MRIAGPFYSRFFADDRGAVTTDWVALTAGVLVLTVLATYGIYGAGLAAAVQDTSDILVAASSLDFGSPPHLNP